MGQVLCIHFILTIYLWKRHSLLPFVDGTLRLRSGSVLPKVTQLGRAGSKASPAPKPASFPLHIRQAGHMGEPSLQGLLWPMALF